MTVARPLVSIVIPTHNSGSLAVEAVESVLAQTYRPVEVLVVDDGSTDSTVEELRRFEPAVRIICQEHRGPAIARNTGIRASTGKVIAFLDSDDIWLPEKLERSIPTLLQDEDVGVVYTDVRVRDLMAGKGQYAPCYHVEGNIWRDVFLECRGISLSTVVARRRCLEEIGLFDEELFRAQDWDLFIRLAERWAYRFIPAVLTVRRVHAKGLSVVHRDLYRKYNLMVIEKTVRRRPDLYAPLLQESLSRAYFRFAMLSYGDFDMGATRKDLIASLKYRAHLRTMNYLLRTFLPVGLLATVRRWKESKRER